MKIGWIIFLVSFVLESKLLVWKKIEFIKGVPKEMEYQAMKEHWINI